MVCVDTINERVIVVLPPRLANTSVSEEPHVDHQPRHPTRCRTCPSRVLVSEPSSVLARTTIGASRPFDRQSQLNWGVDAASPQALPILSSDIVITAPSRAIRSTRWRKL